VFSGWMSAGPRRPTVTTMTDDVPERRRRASTVARSAVAIAIVIGAFLLIPVPHLGLPDAVRDLPDWVRPPHLPGWLRFLLGPGKLVVLAVIAVLLALSDHHRNRRDD
jgi:hypothetical protein